MHAALHLGLIWLLAFLTLGVALFFLNVFGNLIGNDVELGGPRKEAILAGIASFVEAISVWAILTFVPAMYRGRAAQAMILPIIVVGLLYQVTHWDTWNRADAALLLMFQIAVTCLIGFLFTGDFKAAVIVVGAVGAFLGVFAVFARSLG